MSNKNIICIDAGHGGVQPGAVNGTLGYMEKTIALDISLKVRDYLLYAYKDSSNNLIIEDVCNHPHEPLVDVLMTRKGDVDVSLKDRCLLANKEKATFFISIHCNSCKTSGPSGIETWHYTTSQDKPKQLADNIQKSMMEMVKPFSINGQPIKSRGVKSNNTYYTLRHTIMPSIVVECGFMSNNDEVKLMYENESYRIALAKGITKGILLSL